MTEPPSPMTDFSHRAEFGGDDAAVAFSAHERVNVPPADKGFHAYAYLLASFVIELLAWSLPFSYGVFLNYYADVLPQPSSTKLAVVGTLSTGVMYLLYPLVLRATTLFPHLCRHLMAVGLALCVGGLVGAAWSTTVWEFVLTQGPWRA